MQNHGNTSHGPLRHNLFLNYMYMYLLILMLQIKLLL